MTVPLVPRKLIFGNPDREAIQVSPDGEYLAWLAPLDGVLNVWVAPRPDLSSARPFTHDTTRGIRVFWWAFAPNTLLYAQDAGGDENWRLYSIDLAHNALTDLTPFEGVQAQPYQFSPEFPDEILVGLNKDNPELHDLYRLNIKSGALQLLCINEGFRSFLTDEGFNLRGASRMTEDGGVELLKPVPVDGSAGLASETADRWTVWQKVPPEDAMTTFITGFDKSRQTVFIADSRGRDTSALYAMDYDTGDKTLLAEDRHADIDGRLAHPTQKQIQAVSFTYTRKSWKILDPAIAPDWAYLETVADGEIEVTSRSQDDRYWTVQYRVDDGPVRFYLYDREARQASFMFTNQPALEGQPLVKMIPQVIKSSDGLDLVSYYSLPAKSDSNQDGIPDHPLPMVLLPHGGPWGRDVWGYNDHFQWLANRGYAVISVNFRSSTGFGKAFTNAGDKELGGKVIRDQLEAVQWAIRQGIADPHKVAILGGSFGGYSTLAGLTFFPETYAAGVDLFGPANLITLIETTPPYWKPLLAMLNHRVGDLNTPEGRALLEAHSPLTFVDRIRVPLLIGQGVNDPRVRQAESDQIVQAMRAKGLPVTYVLYPDEGHGFARPENRLSFFAIAEAFLSNVLGGRYEPLDDDFQGSSLQILAGKQYVPGLSDT